MSARRWVTAVSLTLVCPVALAQSRPAARVDWPTFLSRQDLVWDRLPTGWGESGVRLGWAPAEARPPRKVYRKDPFAPEDLHPPPVVTRSSDEITSAQSFIGGGAHAEAIVSSQRGRIFYISIGQGSTDREAL